MKYSKIQDKLKTAVALHYDGTQAPRITAKGQGYTAEQIITLAIENDIPLHEDIQLASALSQIPLGEDIPIELYLAVAEILAFIYTLEDTQYEYTNQDIVS